MLSRLGSRAALVTLFVLVGAGGCPAGEDGDGASTVGGGEEGGGGGEEGDDVARLAAAMCERQAACGCVQLGEPLELDDCKDVHRQGLLRMAEATQETESYAFDAACLRELADCWEQLECGDAFEVSCNLDCAVHQRNLDQGSTCESEAYDLRPTSFASECEPGLSCLGGHGYSVCDTPASLELGESCFDGALHRSCASELYCAGVGSGTGSANGSCVPRVEEGDACEFDGACTSGLRCADGTCVQRGEIGDACEVKADCVSGLWCHPEDSLCVDNAEIGEQCRFPDGVNDDLIACVEGAYCGDQNCEAKRDVGSACTELYQCTARSGCEDGVCTACAQRSCPEAPVCHQIPAPFSYPTGD